MPLLIVNSVRSVIKSLHFSPRSVQNKLIMYLFSGNLDIESNGLLLRHLLQLHSYAHIGSVFSLVRLCLSWSNPQSFTLYFTRYFFPFHAMACMAKPLCRQHIFPCLIVCHFIVCHSQSSFTTCVSTLSIISHISSRLLNRAWSSLIKTLRYSRSISSITTFLIAIFHPLRWGGGHGYKF